MQTMSKHVKEGAPYTEGADVYVSDRKQMRKSTA